MIRIRQDVLHSWPTAVVKSESEKIFGSYRNCDCDIIAVVDYYIDMRDRKTN